MLGWLAEALRSFHIAFISLGLSFSLKRGRKAVEPLPQTVLPKLQCWIFERWGKGGRLVTGGLQTFELFPCTPAEIPHPTSQNPETPHLENPDKEGLRQ